MLRKRFKKWVLAGLVLGGLPLTIRAQKSVEDSQSASVARSSVRAEIWKSTAAFVYQDDQALHSIEDDLLRTIEAGSIKKFTASLEKAVMLEDQKIPKQRHVFTFQQLFNDVQTQSPEAKGNAALVQTIATRLAKKERLSDAKRKRRYDELVAQLQQLAGGKLAANVNAGPAVPDPAPVVAAPPVPAPAVVVPETAVFPTAPATQAATVGPDKTPSNPLSLAALGVSILGLIVALLALVKANKTAETPPRDATGGAGRTSNSSRQFEKDEALTKQVKAEVERQMAAAQKVPKQPANIQPATLVKETETPAVPMAPLSVPVLAPGPRLRTQYANEAPFNNSFPARALSDQPGTYSMFAIVSSEQQPDQGTFAVTGNLASHVRDHRSVLEPVCEYVGGYPLGSEARVITVESGLVRRRGDDWEVVQRAKVRFE